MPNKKGGKKYKNKKKRSPTNKELIKKDENEYEDYAYVKQKLGNGRFLVFCNDGKERMGIISGKMRKRTWIDLNTFVLIAKWDFQDEKCNIIHKYEDNDIQKLLKLNEITSHFVNLTSQSEFVNSDDDIFDYNIISDEEEIESDSEKSEKEEINLDEI